MNHQPIFTDFPHIFGILCAPSSSVRVGDYKLIRFYWAGENAKTHYYELFDLKRDLSEAINLASYLPEKVTAMDRLIEAHVKETGAVAPVQNANYVGNPHRSRTNPQTAPDRPLVLQLPETEITTVSSGSRVFQLKDQNNLPCKTSALVLDGSEWVRLEHQLDGSVKVFWDVACKRGAAKVLFGWSGGRTAWGINDWTITPCELILK